MTTVIVLTDEQVRQIVESTDEVLFRDDSGQVVLRIPLPITTGEAAIIAETER